MVLIFEPYNVVRNTFIRKSQPNAMVKVLSSRQGEGSTGTHKYTRFDCMLN